MSVTIQSTSSPESEDLVRNFLKGRFSGVLATADKSGGPHAAVVYYSLQDDFSLTFGTKRETQKFKNMEENSQIAFAVYDEKEQTTIQISGHVEQISNHDEQQKVFRNMFSSSAELSQTELPPAEKLLAGDYVAMRITPMVIKMAVFARPDSEGDDLYETLIFRGEE